MSIFEIVLIIIGAVVFIISFIIPDGKNKNTENQTAISEEKLKEMVDDEIDKAKSNISDIVDETINYAMEKTERSMERLTNEKMMAVNDYSDTVLEEINKNHKEVVFLYDMLNDKHENLISTVSEAAKTVSEVKQTVRDVEVTAREVQQNTEAAVTQAQMKETEFEPINPIIVQNPKPAAETELRTQKPVMQDKPKRTVKKTKSESEEANKKESAQAEVPEVAVRLAEGGGRNSNERILDLHRAGKSNMAIAKELGLGIGEVKLVIDLFEGI